MYAQLDYYSGNTLDNKLLPINTNTLKKSNVAKAFLSAT